jgi:regulator of sigma E protease
MAALAANPDNPLHVTVECTVPVEGRSDAMQSSKLLDVTVPTQPMRTLGMMMTMGEITAIQLGSPADGKITVGDRIVKVDGKPVDDPMRLPFQLRGRAGEEIVVTVEREGSAIDIPVTLSRIDWFEESTRENNRVSIPEVGIAYRILNKVDAVIPGSPAEKAGIKPGDTIKKAVLTAVEEDQHEENNRDKTQKKQAPVEIPFELGDKNYNWPGFFFALQEVNERSPVTLDLDNDRTAQLHAEDAASWFNPDRGFRLEPEASLVKAQSFVQAFQLGGDETWESLTMVVRIMRKLGTQVSVKELSGPIGIAKIAGQAAKQGPAELLLFLTLLSANLAVLNLLPIPVLDGGHLIFLAYEGIRGKPADERVQVGLSLAGLAFLVGLMIYVTKNDVIRLFFK